MFRFSGFIDVLENFLYFFIVPHLFRMLRLLFREAQMSSGKRAFYNDRIGQAFILFHPISDNNLNGLQTRYDGN